MKLSAAQTYLLQRLETAPAAKADDSYCTDRNDNGIIKGCFNSSTLKALEKKGLIIILKDGGRFGDQVRLVSKTSKESTDMKNTKKTASLKINRFASLELALEAASTEERTNHNDARLYNAPAYATKMQGSVGRAKQILVIDGKIYYTFELPGDEKGMTLLNRLETYGSMMHNAPFYRVTLNGGLLEVLTREITEGEANLEAVPFSREMEARQEYARRGWMMTTEVDVVNAYLSAIATDGGDDTPPAAEKKTTSEPIKLAGTFGKYAGIETMSDAKEALHAKDAQIEKLEKSIAKKDAQIQTKENALIHYSYKLTTDFPKEANNDWFIKECRNVLEIAEKMDVQTSTEGLANALAISGR